MLAEKGSATAVGLFGVLRFDRATMDDWARLACWRNDEVTQAASFAVMPMGLAEHLDWLTRVIRNQDIKLFIVRDGTNGTSIGVLRLQLCELKQIEISITVEPRQRGHGYAEAIIGCVDDLLGEWSRYRVVARVKRDNWPSLRLFAANGYRPVAYGVSDVVLERRPW